MPFPLLSKVGRGLRRVWWLLDATRRALLNVLLLAVVIALFVGLFSGGTPALQPKTALVLNLSGRLVEQQSGSVRAGALSQLRGDEGNDQVQLRDVLMVLDAAALDDKVTHALLVLDNFRGAGLADLREVAAGIARFKAAGKPVIAWGSAFDQRQYLLASQASEIWLDPLGSLSVEGYGRLRNYYKDLLDRIGVQVNVVRVGRFKNAGEGFTNSEPSKETLESEGALNQSLWASWTKTVETARKKAPGSVMADIDSLPDSLIAAGGNDARWALELRWVDALKTRQEMREALIQRGERDVANKTFRQVSFNEYLQRIKPKVRGDAVGVIVAEGSISDGRAGPGSIGGLSTSELIRKAREDDQVKAVVLRVNSPGGSAFGSELIRRELDLVRKAGKPVVVSMGDLAASGGFWISQSADEVIADEATITGSIGVFAMLPSGQTALDKLGVHTGGTGTTWLSTAGDPRRDLDPRYARLVQTSIDAIYRDFIQRVAAARKTTPDKIEPVAQGRVWSGSQAKELGLVDRLGSYRDALASAAGRAKLSPDYVVRYIEVDADWTERLLQGLGLPRGMQQALLSAAAHALAPSDASAAALRAGLTLAPGLTSAAWEDLAWLTETTQRRPGFVATVHCLCTAP